MASRIRHIGWALLLLINPTSSLLAQGSVAPPPRPIFFPTPGADVNSDPAPIAPPPPQRLPSQWKKPSGNIAEIRSDKPKRSSTGFGKHRSRFYDPARRPAFHPAKYQSGGDILSKVEAEERLKQNSSRFGTTPVATPLKPAGLPGGSEVQELPPTSGQWRAIPKDPAPIASTNNPIPHHVEKPKVNPVPVSIPATEQGPIATTPDMATSLPKPAPVPLPAVTYDEKPLATVEPQPKPVLAPIPPRVIRSPEPVVIRKPIPTVEQGEPIAVGRPVKPQDKMGKPLAIATSVAPVPVPMGPLNRKRHMTHSTKKPKILFAQDRAGAIAETLTPEESNEKAVEIPKLPSLAVSGGEEQEPQSPIAVSAAKKPKMLSASSLRSQIIQACGHRITQVQMLRQPDGKMYIQVTVPGAWEERDVMQRLMRISEIRSRQVLLNVKVDSQR